MRSISICFNDRNGLADSLPGAVLSTLREGLAIRSVADDKTGKLPQGNEQVPKLWEEGNLSFPGFALCLAELGFIAVLCRIGHGLCNMDEPVGKVDVLPAEGQCLAAPHPGVDEDGKQASVPRLQPIQLGEDFTHVFWLNLLPLRNLIRKGKAF